MSRGTPWIYTCRSAQSEDAESIVQLVNSAYRGEGAKEGWTTEADLLGGVRIDLERVVGLLAHPDQHLLLWLNPETRRPVACVLLERRQGKAYLGMLTVSPQLQNAGMGRQILSVSEAWVKENWQLTAIEMTVISVRQELIDWYVRRGYQLTGERRAFQMNDPRFGIPKVDFLEFVVLEKKL